MIGAADNFCADLAMGAVTCGVYWAIPRGRRPCLDLSVERPTDDPLLALYTHLTPGLLFANAGLNATGAVIAWAAAALAGGSIAGLEALAASAEPDPNAPLLLPYLSTGERTDAAATGVWHGLTLTHDPARLARSVYEGLTFALCDLVNRFRAAGYHLAEARLAGWLTQHLVEQPEGDGVAPPRAPCPPRRCHGARRGPPGGLRRSSSIAALTRRRAPFRAGLHCSQTQ